MRHQCLEIMFLDTKKGHFARFWQKKKKSIDDNLFAFPPVIFEIELLR